MMSESYFQLACNLLHDFYVHVRLWHILSFCPVKCIIVMGGVRDMVGWKHDGVAGLTQLLQTSVLLQRHMKALQRLAAGKRLSVLETQRVK